jgi:hypothetical protein
LQSGSHENRSNSQMQPAQEFSNTTTRNRVPGPQRSTPLCPKIAKWK